MRKKGVLFDKDGTLFAINGIWIDICNELIDEIINKYDLENTLKGDLLESIGIKDNKITSNSILASGTVTEMLQAIYLNFTESSCQEIDSSDFMDYAFNKVVSLNKNAVNKFVVLADLPRIMSRLSIMGFCIGIVTADLRESVIFLLKVKNLLNSFDYIGADDGKTEPKPNPAMFFEFCELCNIKPKEIAVIGDSKKDMEFAKRGGAGLAIGVLSGTSNFTELKENSDYIFDDITEVINSGVLF